MLNTDLCSETFFSGLSTGISIPLTILLVAESTVCEGGGKKTMAAFAWDVAFVWENREGSEKESREK